MSEKRYIDPVMIRQEQMPVIVFAENSKSLISWAIRTKTGGEKNHVMEMTRPGYVTSQGFNGYKEYRIEHYMAPGEDLKFVSLAGVATEKEREAFFEAVSKGLQENFWKRSYDFLGIIGQLTGLKFINNPWKNFCSERTGSYCALIEKLKPFIPYKPSPEQLNEALKKCPGVITLGYWFND